MCPGVVATEFDGGYGHNVPFAMSPDDVAKATAVSGAVVADSMVTAPLLLGDDGTSLTNTFPVPQRRLSHHALERGAEGAFRCISQS